MISNCRRFIEEEKVKGAMLMSQQTMKKFVVCPLAIMVSAFFILLII
jgi:hypothetical protein